MENIFENIKLGKYSQVEIDLSISAFEAFKRLYPHFEDMFLLESLGENGAYNRFSYVGFEPELLITAKNKDLIINNRLVVLENPFLLLKSISKLKSRAQDFCGGLVGYFGYEATGYFEKGFAGHEINEFPNFQFGLYLDGLKFDKRQRKCTYFHYGNNRFGEIIKKLNSGGESLGKFSFKTLKKPEKEKHEEQIQDAIKEIKKGNIFQAVISARTDYQIKGDSRRIYAVLRQVNPSPYMIYLKNGKREIISASPELLIRTKGADIEHFGTLAGTIARGADNREDKRLKDALLGDEKELAEHFMLVDLARNDVGKIAKFGSISVEKLATVKKFSKVQHLYSEIRGELRRGKSAFDAMSACFPAGTLTGAPKVEAMKIIKRLEGEARGPYGGTAGYFSLNGDAMMAIIIRSLFVNGNYAYTQTGSGIVLDSKPDKEFQEILDKQKGMDETLKRASV